MVNRQRSTIFRRAVDEYHECRAAYENAKLAAFIRAQDDTNGAMLNARGKRARIDVYSLFSGNETRARAYASEELLEHWARYPRVTYTQWEREYSSPVVWSGEVR